MIRLSCSLAIYMEIKGLTEKEVQQKKSLGLSNEVIDSYNSTYWQIVLRNVFSLINIVLFPLLIALGYLRLYSEIFAFSTFLIINTIVSIVDEVRIKRKLDNLKSEFQVTAKVIRDGQDLEIPVSEIVQGDYVIASEGDGIIADGEIIDENYLQVDESMLTGESNYLRRDKGERVLSGSYVVTGNCIYLVESVGKNNYLNKLGSEAVKLKEKRSPVQRAADRIVLFLTFSAIFAGAVNLAVVLNNGTSYEAAILSVTTIVALIIPQTLIFLFTLTYTISITKLYSKGILIQKGGSIEELANVNVICFDKTGTITTNKMVLREVKYFNLEEKTFGDFYNSIAKKLVSVNSTQKIVNNKFSKFEKFEISNFDQIPFTSKQKYSLVKAEKDGKTLVIALGAFSSLNSSIRSDMRDEIQKYMQSEESKGMRVLIGIYKEMNPSSFDLENPLGFESSEVVVFSIEETLNPGINEILDKLRAQDIAVKIISGDSKVSVTRICQKIGIDPEQIVDLSENPDIVDEKSFVDAVVSKTVFTRAKPEDKLKIINILNHEGFKTAMVGDGINDVLGLKAASVSIAMESGAKIAREVSDIVLLKNDYQKIPDVFYEGDNIIFNLKLSTKIFLAKSISAILMSLFYTLRLEVMPLHPSSTLIFSFLGSSVPSYVVIFTRQKVENAEHFFRNVLSSALPTAAIFAGLFILLDQVFLAGKYDFVTINTALVIFFLGVSIIYSLYLVWEAKKVSSIFAQIGLFTILMLLGISQTILPINLNDPLYVNLFLLWVMAMGGVLLFYIFNKVLSPKRFIYRIGLLVPAFIWIPVVSVFPFQSYYHVTRIPLNLYGLIALFIVLGLALIVIFNTITKKLFR